MLGAIFAPFGISGALANFSGEGFSVMITVGGYNMYNVGIELAAGNLAGAGVHLEPFLLAVAGLAITALFTFFIYNWTFGRKPLEQVHAEKALNSLKEPRLRRLHGEEARQGRARGLRRRGRKRCACRYERVGEGLSDRFSYDGCASYALPRDCVPRNSRCWSAFRNASCFAFHLDGLSSYGGSPLFSRACPILDGIGF